jgi:hypothetical protein
MAHPGEDDSHHARRRMHVGEGRGRTCREGVTLRVALIPTKILLQSCLHGLEALSAWEDGKVKRSRAWLQRMSPGRSAVSISSNACAELDPSDPSGLLWVGYSDLLVRLCQTG